MGHASTRHIGGRWSVGWVAVVALAAMLAAPMAPGGTGALGAGVAGAGEAGAVEAQSPFLCTTEYNGLGQPTVDNQEHRGTPVYPLGGGGQPDRTQEPLGWSERCQADEVVEYRYRTVGGSLQTLSPGAVTLPADIAFLPVADLVGADDMDLGGATEIPYLLRFQRGTLPGTRFLYSIAMLVPFEEITSGTPSTDHWNGRLLFGFGGGVGIGHSQGDLSTGAATQDEAMRLGHAVLYTSGTRTSVHYNLMLGGRTAVEAKALFAARYGDPRYTVGIGGSGGGIQQYVYAQNHPDLLDALIPQYSYPDMSTQTIHIGDCELLAHYMDELDGANPRWANWDNRTVVQGLNTIQGFTSTWQNRTGAPGSTECIEGWRGSTPLAMNPNFGLGTRMDTVLLPFAGEILTKLAADEPPVPDDFPDLGRLLRVSPDAADWVEWTHWDDVIEVYGSDPATGYARVPWDNVGVQYGLRAVADGTLTPEEFLDLNARVGSWKDSEHTVPESCGLIGAMVGAELGAFAQLLGLCEGAELDEHSARQMHYSTDPATPAPRRTGDIDAIRAAYASGLVFNGHLPREVPIIDSRHYLEHQLDMHNTQQSFGVRERIRRAGGNVDNHLVWFLDARPSIDAAATFQLHADAFRLVDDWVLAIQADPAGSVAAARPAAAVDRCWDTDGTLVAEGPDVWSGAVELVTSGAGDWQGVAPTEVDGVPVGGCAAHFPLYSTSRIVAGGPITGDVYKCRTMSVADAIDAGLYGLWNPTADEQARLEAMHPEGVCDYARVGVGSPFNGAPVAPDASVTTTESVPVAVPLAADDPDGDPLTYLVDEPPTAGTLSGDAPEVTYTPNDGFVGTDTFTWRAHDGDLTSPPATMVITVVAEVPPTTTPTTTPTTAPATTAPTTPASTVPTAPVPPSGFTDTPDPSDRYHQEYATVRAAPSSTPSRPRGPLPRTGAGVLALAAVGLLALTGGATLTRLRNR